MNKNLHESFLQLVRVGIGTSKGAIISKKVDWVQIKALADRQGLSAVVLDGIDKLNTNLSNSTNELPLDLKLEWIGEVLQNYEQRYKSYEKAISILAGFYNQHGYKMMVLKGYSCSLNWPKPNHRPCGDIDIWQFGQQKEADKVLANTNFTNGTNIKIDTSHHHHTVFDWNGFTVENHYDFINVHHHKSHVEFEKILKELGSISNVNDNDNPETNTNGTNITNVLVNGEKVYLPSPNLHALFLIKHLMLHFSTGEINLRQLLDWAFFVEKHGKEVDWKWLMGVIEEYGMSPAFNIFNAICVEELGFDAYIFPQVQFDPFLKERVLNDILSPEFRGEEPQKVIPRILFKYRRWKANGWKNELCFKESMWSAFWSGVWGHLLKPSSI